MLRIGAIEPATCSLSVSDACITIASRVVSSAPMQSHSLRRGWAVSMLSVGVPLTKICEWGAWAGPASVQPYIVGRAFTRPTPADIICFGWMTSQSHPSIGVSSPLV